MAKITTNARERTMADKITVTMPIDDYETCPGLALEWDKLMNDDEDDDESAIQEAE